MGKMRRKLVTLRSKHRREKQQEYSNRLCSWYLSVQAILSKVNIRTLLWLCRMRTIPINADIISRRIFSSCCCVTFYDLFIITIFMVIMLGGFKYKYFNSIRGWNVSPS